MSDAAKEVELSTAARVKAHISTAYIVADGRGTRPLPGLNCLLPPAQFRALEAAEARDLAAELDAVERRAAAVDARLDARRASRDAQVRQQLLAEAADARTACDAVAASRAARIVASRRADQETLDAAYARRLEGPDALAKFEMLSKATPLQLVREREADVADRMARLRTRTQPPPAVLPPPPPPSSDAAPA